MPGKNPWLAHVAKVWPKMKKAGKSYRQCLVEAKKSYSKQKKSKASKKKAEQK
jgi:hypothetical protein